MRDLSQLGFTKSGNRAKLLVRVDERSVELPTDYADFLQYSPPDNLDLSFKFRDSLTNEEWEGQVVEFMQYDAASVREAAIAPPDQPHRKLLPLCCDAGGNYLYLELTAVPMCVIGVDYAKGTESIVAQSFTDFVDALFRPDI